MGLLDNIRAIRDRQLKKAEANARASLARARTNAERERVRLKLKRDRYAIEKQVADAKALTQKAKSEADKARRDAGYVPSGERLAKGLFAFGRGAAAAAGAAGRGMVRATDEINRRQFGAPAPRRKTRKTTRRRS